MQQHTSTSELNARFFGHPAGLQTLFFTEMWERMSYYGMRALLVLFMTASLQEGGLASSVATATAIYGLYTGAVYFAGLPGGWISDRVLGGQKAVWYGGLVIMAGHIVLALPFEQTFYIGLILVVLGTGLLKPNISALVGLLYRSNDERRDSGFTIYYMGINIGSFIGYTVTGFAAEKIGWHWGFGAAAVGMALGLVQYRRTLPNLEGVGSAPIAPLSAPALRKFWYATWIFIVAIFALTALILNDIIPFNPIAISGYVVVSIALVFIACFGYLFFLGGLNDVEKKKLYALLLICIASSCFWAGFEQAGSSLNLFCRDFTDRMVGSFELPVAWFQNANPFFIVILSPFFAALWINLGKRMLDPSYGAKCGLGLVIMASGFLVMFFAAHLAASGLKVAPYWLVITYFLHTVGELCLSPVALSAVSKLAPRRLAGQFMGLFVLTYSMGNVIAGLFAGNFNPENPAEMPPLFMQISLFGIGIGVLVLLVSLKTRSWEKLTNQDSQKTNPVSSSSPELAH